MFKVFVFVEDFVYCCDDIVDSDFGYGFGCDVVLKS